MDIYELMLAEIRHKLIALTNPEDAMFLQRYFKTGTGQYGEGDLFRGIRVKDGIHNGLVTMEIMTVNETPHNHHCNNPFNRVYRRLGHLRYRCPSV
jgi:hypothetical protein